VPKRATSKGTSIRIPPSLRRRDAVAIPKPVIEVFCEGKTEADYLDDFSRDVGNALVTVMTVPQAGVPRTLVDRAVARRRELKSKANRANADSFDGVFTVWAMFDRDDHPGVDDAKAKARANGVRLAFSNPCVELWALLHFYEHNAPDPRSDIQSKLKKYMPSYNHRGRAIFDYKMLRDKLRKATKCALRLRKLRERQRDPEGNPFTSVYELTDQILSAAGKLPSRDISKDDLTKELSQLKATAEYNAGDSMIHRRVSEIHASLKLIDKPADN
jgi:hypothetical protein